MRLLGSSTACILAFDQRDGTLESCNLGDSGFLVIRDGKVVARSQEQQHYFNAPFQLSIIPPALRPQRRSWEDKPEDSQLATTQLRHGDVIVLATDGLFDNVFDDEIVHKVESSLEKFRPTLSGLSNETARSIATELVSTAWSLANDAKRMSPFADNARKKNISTIGGYDHQARSSFKMYEFAHCFL